MNRTAGFSLIEVMCAILILGIGLVGLTQGITTALSSSKESEMQTSAALIAAGRIETLRADGYLKDGVEAGEGGEGLSLYRWKQTITSTTINGLHEVEVVVENAKSGRTIYELRTLLFDPPIDSSQEDSSRRRNPAAAQKERKQKAMNAQASRPISAGFTLIELSISAALMAMILVSAYLCLSAGVSSQRLVESRTGVVQSARVAMALMSADLRCACPLSKDYAFLGMKRTLGEVQADNLDFATHNYTPRRTREGDWCEVSYFLDKDRASGQFSLWRRRDPTPDDEPLSGGSREEIVPGVRGLNFEYYDGFDWYDEWGDPEGRHKGQTTSLDLSNLSGMPEAVRITLWLDPGSRPGKEASPEKDSAEPPLVFQTVARLNLAAISQSSASGSTTSGPGNQTSPPAPMPLP